ncbi:chemotaxis protein CheC [Paenalkalicoccus suaedae]|uniref:Chemotaxis protein CheC n=1 Tax=Paenalkalicoccus suaedae TaxID=2592382 RepID=A0A859FGT2_9BACI|nr:chemotaxis protein CheC [Paenalkalicoccus suaedae]QKS71415.1 chemotaxis protein CheC [Paenalkalicoccus suaedae]
MTLLNERQRDVLKEIGNIGAAHAATSLSQLLNKKIDMRVPAVSVVPFHEISEYVGGEDEPVAAVMLKIEGDAPGTMFFMIPIQEANELIRYLTGNSSTDLIDEINGDSESISVSAFNEVGNILAGSYLSSLSDFTGLTLAPTPPASAVDMATAILSYGLIEVSKEMDSALVIDTVITEPDTTIQTMRGHFFLLPDPDSLATIFTSLGVNDYDNDH